MSARHMRVQPPSRAASRLVLVVMVCSILACASIAVLDIHLTDVGLMTVLVDGMNRWRWLSVANVCVIQLAVAAMSLTCLFEWRGDVGSARAMTRVAVVLILAMALLCVVINGFVWMLSLYMLQLVLVVAYQVLNDPNLGDSVPWAGLGIRERLFAAFGVFGSVGGGRHLRADITPDEIAYRKAYMPLNAFNVTWLFFVGSVVGLVLETIWHLACFGEWQDRAGLVWGPLSPIYGVGAVVLSLALNRFWRANPFVIFLVSGITGSVVEYLTSLYLEAAVGVVAWDYTGTIGSIHGRTNLFFFVCWGALGVMWMRFLLPCTMRLVDAIPLSVRAFLTTVLFAFLIVDFSVTVIACDSWSKRHAGHVPANAVEVLCDQYFGDEWMASRFETMTFGDEAVHVQIEEDAGLRLV